MLTFAIERTNACPKYAVAFSIRACQLVKFISVSSNHSRPLLDAISEFCRAAHFLWPLLYKDEGWSGEDKASPTFVYILVLHNIQSIWMCHSQCLCSSERIKGIWWPTLLWDGGVGWAFSSSMSSCAMWRTGWTLCNSKNVQLLVYLIYVYLLLEHLRYLYNVWLHSYVLSVGLFMILTFIINLYIYFSPPLDWLCARQLCISIEGEKLLFFFSAIWEYWISSKYFFCLQAGDILGSIQRFQRQHAPSLITRETYLTCDVPSVLEGHLLVVIPWTSGLYPLS